MALEHATKPIRGWASSAGEADRALLIALTHKDRVQDPILVGMIDTHRQRNFIWETSDQKPLTSQKSNTETKLWFSGRIKHSEQPGSGGVRL